MRYHYIYDWENFNNFSCITIIRDEDEAMWVFEISPWLNQGRELNLFLNQVRMSGGRMVGFNNVGYDYPVTHTLMQYQGVTTPEILYNRGQSIICAENRWDNVIWERDRFIPQVDLFLIHHFDNKAKSTSLKLLEFNMRMNDIQELPFNPHIPLTYEQSREVIRYNIHDVKATRLFFHHSKDAVKFRDELSVKYGRDFTNHNDTKIGADIVKMELEKRGVRVHKSIQTIRKQIVVNDIIFPYIQFERPEFNRVLDYFRRSVIDPEKIKGFFKESDEDEETKFTSATIDGFTFDFGAGGIHGSVSREVVVPGPDEELIDSDVASYYPNIGIVNKLYPAHLGEGWCDAMDSMFHERLRVGKKTAEGNAYKLGLNGGYGKSNDKHSPFLDPQYTMSITINGQLMLCMLAEQLMKVPGLRMIQINTDGLTYVVPKQYVEHCMNVSKWWETLTKLELEHAYYSKMIVRDVNSYIAVKTDGGVKRIGAYAYVRAEEDNSTRELPWHKNHSAIVVAKAAEAHMVYGKDITQFIINHAKTDPWDFLLRAKAPRSARVVTCESNEKVVTEYVDDIGLVELRDGETLVPNITRYYASIDGVYLYKIMKPTTVQIDNWNTVPHWYHVDTGAHKCAKKAPSGKWVEGTKPSDIPPMRRIGIDSGHRVTVCNSIPGELVLTGLDVSYYVKAVEKLVIT